MSGQSGDVSYPDYMENTHDNWLTGAAGGGDNMTSSIQILMEAAHDLANTPWSDTAYDPSTPIAAADAQFVIADNLMDAIVAETTWASYVDKTVTKFSSFWDINFLDSMSTAIDGLLSSLDTVLSSTAITNMVEQFEKNSLPRFLRGVSRFAGGMAEINSVNTSSFIIGLAIMQGDYQNEINKFEADVQKEVYVSILRDGIAGLIKAEVAQSVAKDGLISSGSSLMGQLDTFKANLSAQLTSIQAEITKLTILAKTDEQNTQMKWDVEDAEWDMNVYMFGGNVMGAIAGAAAGRKGSSDAQSALSGALGAAGVAAAAGASGGLIAGVAGAGALLGYALNN